MWMRACPFESRLKEKFHPGTLNSDTASELLDLARQAARIHPVSHVQVLLLAFRNQRQPHLGHSYVLWFWSPVDPFLAHMRFEAESAFLVDATLTL